MKKTRWLAPLMVGIMGLSVLGAAPVAAQGEPVCIGGLPVYWQDPANTWPDDNIPLRFQNPNRNRTSIHPWTRFDDVFRWRNGRDQEGPIYRQMTLRQVLDTTGRGLNAMSRQAIAALLNAASLPDNSFPQTMGRVIYDFQVHWDGTEDMTPRQARRFMRDRYKEWNLLACPPPAPTATAQ